jgi:hypothetical protein
MQIIDLVAWNIENAQENLERAYECWRRWHNPMSRRWLRECIAEYRMATFVALT